MKIFIIGIIGTIFFVAMIIIAIPTINKFLPESEIIEGFEIATGVLQTFDIVDINLNKNIPYNYVYIDENGNRSLLNHFGPIAKLGIINIGDRIICSKTVPCYLIEGGAQ